MQRVANMQDAREASDEMHNDDNDVAANILVDISEEEEGTFRMSVIGRLVRLSLVGLGVVLDKGTMMMMKMIQSLPLQRLMQLVLHRSGA
jgi:hypothetical protein